MSTCYYINVFIGRLSTLAQPAFWWGLQAVSGVQACVFAVLPLVVCIDRSAICGPCRMHATLPLKKMIGKPAQDH